MNHPVDRLPHNVKAALLELATSLHCADCSDKVATAMVSRYEQASPAARVEVAEQIMFLVLGFLESLTTDDRRRLAHVVIDSMKRTMGTELAAPPSGDLPSGELN